MTAKEVLDDMHKGATLCIEHTKDGRVFWLEPRRIIVRTDVADRVIEFPGIVPGGDRLFKDAASQTWKAAR
jgi:hypothetical protein